MNPVSSAPALVLLLAASTGLSAFRFGMSGTAAVALGGLLTGAVLALTPGMERRVFRRTAGFILAAALIVAAWCVFSVSDEPHLPQNVDGPFQVLQARSWGGRRLLVLDGREGRFIALTGPDRSFREGTVVRVSGRTVPLKVAEGERDFDPRDYWRARGVTAELEITRIRRSGKEGTALHRWRQALRERLLLRLPRRVRSYLLAAWLGDRDPDLQERHRVWGTSHLLAVSGFHVGLVCAGAFVIFRRLRFREIPLSIVLWAYVLLAGASASALRAGLMLQIMLAGSFAGRGANPLNSVAAAGVLLLLWRPFLFWDVGWRLSVLAALTLAALSRFERKPLALAASPLVWLVTAGPAAWTFGSVPLCGLVLNLAALPLFALLLPFAALSALPVLAGTGRFPALPAEMALGMWSLLADTVARLLPWSLSGSKSLCLVSGSAFLALICRCLGYSLFRTVLIVTALLLMGALIS